MRRIARWTLNALTALSLLLCVGTAALWAASYNNRGFWLADPYGGVRIQSNGATWAIRFVDGTFWVTHYLPDANVPLAKSERGWNVVHQIGYRYYELGVERWSDMGATLWLIVAITAAMPSWRFLPMLARKWRRARGGNSCTRCRYDLTGNVSGICPECGTSIAKAPSPPAESFR